MNSINGPASNTSGYGTGVSWHIGVTTLRKLSEANGLEIGILYFGSWHQRFMYDGPTEWQHMKNSDINPLSKNPSEVLQFISQRFVLSLNILTGKKGHRTKAK